MVGVKTCRMYVVLPRYLDKVIASDVRALSSISSADFEFFESHFEFSFSDHHCSRHQILQMGR
jgi:hypothetical protein